MALSMNGLVYIIEEVQKMGGAVTQQLIDVVNGEDLEEQNPTALRYILDFLDSFGDNEVETTEVATPIRDYLKELDSPGTV